MKLITTFFSSAKSGEKGAKKSKRRSMNRSDTPSFGSSASSSSTDSFSKAAGAAPQTPRSVILGRNASCLDAEYCSSSSSTSSIPAAVSELFCVFDRDGDGKITKEELEAVLGRLGKSHPPTEEEVAMMLAEVDRDGDGCISLEDFEALGLALGPRRAGGGPEGAEEEEEELRDAFGVFDADGDGMISAEELLGVFRALGDDGCTLNDCRRMIGGVDSRGGGFVCFDDFVRMMDGQRCG